MKKKDIITTKDTLKSIVFRNGFIRLDRDPEGLYTSIPGHSYLLKVIFNFPRRNRKRLQMKKIRFADPLPPLTF